MYYRLVLDQLGYLNYARGWISIDFSATARSQGSNSLATLAHGSVFQRPQRAEPLRQACRQKNLTKISRGLQIPVYTLTFVVSIRPAPHEENRSHHQAVQA